MAVDFQTDSKMRTAGDGIEEHTETHAGKRKPKRHRQSGSRVTLNSCCEQPIAVFQSEVTISTATNRMRRGRERQGERQGERGKDVSSHKNDLLQPVGKFFGIGIGRRILLRFGIGRPLEHFGRFHMLKQLYGRLKPF